MKQSSRRSLKMGSFYLLLTALSLLVLILLNLVVEKLPASWTQQSMTAADILEMEDGTKRFLSDLDRDVTVYWIVRGGQEDTYLERLLEKMDETSVHLRVEKTDPVVEPGIITRYTSGSVNQNSVVAVCGAKSEYVDYTALYLRDETDSQKAVFNAESAICTAIRTVTSDAAKKIYMLTGHGEPELPESFSQALEEQGFTLSSLSLLASGIPDDCGSLLVTGAETDLSDAEAEQLGGYLRACGRLCLFTRYLDESTPNWNALLAAYGLSAETGLIVEAQSGWFASDYPYYLLPKISEADANEALTQSGLRVMLPLTQPLSISQTLPEGVACQSLFATSTNAYSKRAGFAMQTTSREESDVKGSFCVGVSAERAVSGGESSRLCWFPTAYALNDTVNNSVSGGNARLLVSSLSWLLGTQSAAVPSGKQLGGGTLNVNTPAADVWSVVVIAVVPLAVALCGVVTLRRRKRR